MKIKLIAYDFFNRKKQITLTVNKNCALLNEAILAIKSDLQSYEIDNKKNILNHKKKPCNLLVSIDKDLLDGFKFYLYKDGIHFHSKTFYLDTLRKELSQ